MALRDLLLLIFALAALYGLIDLLKGRAPAAALGLVALGACVGYILESADGDRLRNALSPSPPVSQPAPSLDARDPGTAGSGLRQLQGTVPTERRSEPADSSPKLRTRTRAHPKRSQIADGTGSGLEIFVSGSWGSLDASVVESAVRAALNRADSDDLHSGAPTVLRIRGSLTDRGLTLGQIPTAAANFNWTLHSASGAIIERGGALDLQGTGTDRTAAELAALHRAANEIVRSIAH